MTRNYRFATAVFVLMATACTGGGSPSSSPTGTGNGSSNAPAADVVLATEVGPEPTTLAVGDGSLWVADDFGVERLDAATGNLLAGITAGPVGDVALGDEGVWILGYGANQVAEVDPATNTITRTVPLDRPTGIAVGERSVWVASRPNGIVTRLDPQTGKTTASITFEPDPPRFFPSTVAPTGIAVAAGAVWVADDASGVLAKIDPTTNEVTDRIAIDGGPVDVSGTDGAIWTTAPKTSAVVHIDPATDQVAATVALPAVPNGVSATEGAVWVTGSEIGPGLVLVDGMLIRVDPTTDRVAGRSTVTDQMSGVIQDGDRVFAAVHALINAGQYYHPSDEVIGVDPSAGATSGSAPSPAPAATGILPLVWTRAVAFTPKLLCAIGASAQHCRPLLDVLAPEGATGLPVIVVAHGGPCGEGCRAYLDQQASALALDGTVVFNTDYRDDVGSVDDQTNDISCAIAFARQHADEYGGDGSRVTLVGHSLGSIRGGTAALVDSVSSKHCLSSASGLPDAFVGLGANPTMPAAYYGENPSLQVRLLIGTRDDPSQFANMKSTAEALAQAGYDATFTPVPGANHFSAFEVGSGSPAFRIILEAARG